MGEYQGGKQRSLEINKDTKNEIIEVRIMF
jgi:hypothetical protein